MEIVETTKPTQLHLRESFLDPYRRKGDPFTSLLARSTYLTKYSRGNVETWTDTIRRVVEGNCSLGKGVSEAEAELLFHLFWTGQALPPGRGLWTGGVAGIPADAMFNCFAPETKFFANGALITLAEAVGQTVEVLAKDGQWRPAQVRSFGTQKLRRICFKAPGRSNFGFDFSATSEHRWFTANRGEVTDLRVGDRVLVTPQAPNTASSAFTDGFAHGFVFGDGSYEALKGLFRLRLCGEKARHKDTLRKASTFHNESNPPSFGQDPLLLFKSTGDLKALPPPASSVDYKAGFLAGWLAADGSLRTSGVSGNRLAAQNADALDWAVEWAPLLGYCVTGRLTDPNTETSFGSRHSRLETLTLTSSPVEYTVRAIVDEGREEEVFCVTEPETHSFTLGGGVATGNCWYTTIYGIDDWCWAANQLMLGGGVGLGLSGIDGLPGVADNDAKFAIHCRDSHKNFGEVAPEGPAYLNGSTPVLRVPDSREGWVQAIRNTMQAAFDGRDLVVDVSDIRPRGQPIRTFGGVACGPGPLSALLRASWGIIRGARGRKLTTVEALDITNHIGLCIKAGNVRRSALIVLGSPDDQPFRDAKKDWDAVKNHRHTSNNSIVFDSWEQIQRFDWHSLVNDNIQFGEPGLLNLPLIRKTDPGARGVNPCFSGATLIAVADGRNAVTIKQLAEEGRDVPVYSMDKETGKVEIKMGRHPRVTGHQKKLVRVWLDDGGYLDTTPDHKFVLMDGRVVEASSLESGSSLPRFTKTLERVKRDSNDYYLVSCDTRNPVAGMVFEHRLIARFHNPAMRAVELGLEHSDEDPRVLKTFIAMQEQGYVSKILNGKVFVERTCEGCSASFEVEHLLRERGFCSALCSSHYINTNAAIKQRRVNGLHQSYAQRQSEQTRVCSGLRFQLGRDPNRKEWSAACKKEGVPSRIGPTLKFGFQHFSEVLEAGANYNHKVVRVEELPGLHTVYNITVDDFHTVAAVSSTGLKRGNTTYTGVYVGNCGEVPLHDREACNLAEVFPSMFHSNADPTNVFRLVTRYCLRNRLPTLSDARANAIQEKNMRLGVGLGGLCDFDWTPEQLANWYGSVRREADSYADELGVSRPIAVTTVKPSGTISLLNGSSPGIHAPHAPYYMRRTRIAKNDPQAAVMMEAGVPYEDCVYDKTGHTWVFSFPTKAPNARATKVTETIREQFERQVTVQEWWSDNAVSATLNFDPETEREELARCLAQYVPRLKSTSCLASAHGYEQAPYEECTKEEFERAYSKINHDHKLVHGGEIEIDECQGGACPVR